MKSGWILRAGAAEFPHENALLDRGALWIGTAMCGAEIDLAPNVAAPPTAPPRVAAAPRASEHAQILPPPLAAPATASALTSAPSPSAVAAPSLPPPPQQILPPPPPHERVETFVRAISEVALAHGAAETAAHVESLFKFGTPAPLALSDGARAALFDGNILEASDGGVHATAWFATTSSAWQSLLRGEAGDLAVCGESTLDGWTADLIARLVANPGMAQTIRRDLRRRGIAAFGMLES